MRSQTRIGLILAALSCMPSPALAVPIGEIVIIEWTGMVTGYAPADDSSNDHVVVDTGMTGRIVIELVEGVDTTLPLAPLYGYRDGYGEIWDATFSLTFEDEFLNGEFDVWSGCDVDCVLAVASPTDIFFEGLHDPEDVGFYLGQPFDSPFPQPVRNRWDQSGDGDCSVCGAFVVGTISSASITFQAVPEPGTFLLLGVGLGAVALVRRRRGAIPSSGLAWRRAS